MRRLRLAAPLALLLAGCQTDQQAAPSAQPPDARAAIVAAKGLLYKDPDSIKGASITAPRRHMANGAGYSAAQAGRKTESLSIDRLPADS